MKFCPTDGMTQMKTGLKVCEFCVCEVKPLKILSEQEIRDLMDFYEYERIEDGEQIAEDKNVRDIALRDSVAIPTACDQD